MPSRCSEPARSLTTPPDGCHQLTGAALERAQAAWQRAVAPARQRWVKAAEGGEGKAGLSFQRGSTATRRFFDVPVSEFLEADDVFLELAEDKRIVGLMERLISTTTATRGVQLAAVQPRTVVPGAEGYTSWCGQPLPFALPQRKPLTVLLAQAS